MSGAKDQRDLHSWYAEKRRQPFATFSAKDHLFCAAILSMGEDPLSVFDSWCKHLIAFAQARDAGTDTLSQVEHALGPYQLSFLELSSKYAEAVVGDVDSKRLLDAVQSVADRVDFVAFRFLVAWLALNIGDRERCISECEKVDEPFAAIHTLHGQALLESGQVSDAIEVLGVAVKLAPREPLAWFQLAKAALVANKCADAWSALQACEQITGANSEIAMLRALTAMQMGGAFSDECVEARRGLWQAYQDGQRDPQLLTLVLQLTLEIGDQAFFGKVVRDVDWRDLIFAQNGMGMVTKLAKTLQSKGWHSEAVLLMDRVIEVTSAKA